MLTYVTADIDCPACLNLVVDTILATPGVRFVDSKADTCCVAITHDCDERALISTIVNVGHTVDVAPNGEIVMGQAHAMSAVACGAHPQR